MALSSRTAQYNNLHKILKKRYKPVIAPPDRPVLETLLFGCCLENAHYEAADEAFAAMVHNFFDFNEVRVSSVRELSEVMARLPDPSVTAGRVKRILQEVFEATYSFELEDLRKQNLGPAVERLEKLGGTTRFSVAYVVQATLGGHSIPIDSGTLQALHVVDLVTDEDVQAGVVPGLERAIAKNKGEEFGSLLHQLGADFTANPYAPALHELLLQINPEAQARLPKRRAAKAAEQAEPERSRAAEAAPKARADEPSSSVPAAETGRRRKRKSAAEEPAKAATGDADGAPSTDATAHPAEPPVSPAGKPPAGKKKSEPSTKKTAGGKKAKPAAEVAAGETGASGLPKRKPR